MSAENLTLAGEFATPAREQWLELVAAVLKGASFDQKLVTHTYDGVSIQPLYTADTPVAEGLPGVAPFVRGARSAGQLGGWDVRQYHADPDPVATNAAILADLERGVTSIWLRVGGNGISVDDLDRALDGVYLDLAPIVLDIGGDAMRAVDALRSLWSARGVPASAALGNFGLDPMSGQVSMDDAVGVARRCARTYTSVRALVVDGSAVNARGGSDVDELGCLLALGVNYLRALTSGSHALDIDAALAQIEFRLAATNDQFSTIAKMRAARRLWARVAEVCGASATSPAMQQHAITSRAMLTQRDPWVNILRSTVACFGAGLGGADAITLLPFDDAIGLPDGFARRVARNTQAVLINEANIARVIDPGGGSWYIESLTDDFARAGWSWFREIEAAGGWDAASAAGLISQQIDRARDKRAQNVARRRHLITGVTEFPDIDEARVTRDRAPATTVERYAAPFEALRDRSDTAASAGLRPTIFLANIGPIAAHAPRSAFARTFFEIGGIAAPGSEPLDDAGAAAAAFAASGLTHAVICSSDKLYETHAVAVAEALRALGAKRIYLAGNPGDNRERFAAAGIDEFIYVGCDALDALGRAVATLGVA
ncbi:MAG TPA: methylmalonyl-CoA mutase family protein [Acidimicrobiales bacterium]|nr:methylmalonyl-CoA mutase family protein [Acidimicrobiales bacterium]